GKQQNLNTDKCRSQKPIITFFLIHQFSDGHTTALQLIENMGFDVGQRYIEKLTKNSPRFLSELEIVKFICKGFWSSLFRKDISSLKTNNTDVYVLTDSAFPFLCRIEPSQQYNPIVEMILAFPCGLLRGALSSLGLCCIVNADVINLPSCQFTVRVLPRSKSSGM
ncbi:unnamed protein product, partial [Mesocestoides corti]